MHHQALVYGLVLAVTAPDDNKAQEALRLAQSIAEGMTNAEVRAAQKEAESVLAELSA